MATGQMTPVLYASAGRLFLGNRVLSRNNSREREVLYSHGVYTGNNNTSVTRAGTSLSQLKCKSIHPSNIFDNTHNIVVLKCELSLQSKHTARLPSIPNFSL